MILVEHGPDGRPAVFRKARDWIVCSHLREVGVALDRAEAARQGGAWVAGCLAYEAAFAFEPRLGVPHPQDGPLLALGVFDGPEEAGGVLEAADAQATESRMTAPEPLVTQGAYDAAMASVLAYIAAGDCYQINLTFPMMAQLMSGSPLGLYGQLRRTGAVGHGAYVDTGLPGVPVLVSRSPELFFRLDAQGGIAARPMKGTAPRDADPLRDETLARALQHSVKDRAENLMIVDLLRNDISRLARVGSVRVPSLFQIEHYATVHQMTSTITGQLAAPARLPALMQALFPCGSVTGAPKIRAMQIIREVEPHPRGAYCGAVGWMAPDGSADFSVAIRTLSVSGQEIVMNVGGGVVHDSTAAGEWEEALWKARFVKAAVTRS